MLDGIDIKAIRTWNIKSNEINNTINKKKYRKLKGGGRKPHSSKYKIVFLEFNKRCNNAGVAINYKIIINYLLYLEEIEYKELINNNNLDN
jgi:hypothetical protein